MFILLNSVLSLITVHAEWECNAVVNLSRIIALSTPQKELQPTDKIFPSAGSVTSTLKVTPMDERYYILSLRRTTSLLPWLTVLLNLSLLKLPSHP